MKYIYNCLKKRYYCLTRTLELFCFVLILLFSCSLSTSHSTYLAPFLSIHIAIILIIPSKLFKPEQYQYMHSFKKADNLNIIILITIVSEGCKRTRESVVHMGMHVFWVCILPWFFQGTHCYQFSCFSNHHFHIYKILKHTYT